MGFKVLTDEQLELLTDTQRANYEEERSKYEERLKFVQQIEKYEDVELPEVNPVLKPIAVSEGMDISAISIEKTEVRIPEAGINPFPDKLPDLPEDILHITNIPDISVGSPDINEPTFDPVSIKVPDEFSQKTRTYEIVLPKDTTIAMPELSSPNSLKPNVEIKIETTVQIPEQNIHATSERSFLDTKMSKYEGSELISMPKIIEIDNNLHLPKTIETKIAKNDINIQEFTSTIPQEKLPKISEDLVQSVEIHVSLIEANNIREIKMEEISSNVAGIPDVNAKMVLSSVS